MWVNIQDKYNIVVLWAIGVVFMFWICVVKGVNIDVNKSSIKFELYKLKAHNCPRISLLSCSPFCFSC